MQGVQMDEVLAAPQIVQLHCRPMIFNAQNMRPRGLQDGTYHPADHTGKNMRKPPLMLNPSTATHHIFQSGIFFGNVIEGSPTNVFYLFDLLLGPMGPGTLCRLILVCKKETPQIDTK